MVVKNTQGDEELRMVLRKVVHVMELQISTKSTNEFRTHTEKKISFSFTFFFDIIFFFSIPHICYRIHLIFTIGVKFFIIPIIIRLIIIEFLTILYLAYFYIKIFKISILNKNFCASIHNRNKLHSFYGSNSFC